MGRSLDDTLRAVEKLMESAITLPTRDEGGDKAVSPSNVTRRRTFACDTTRQRSIECNRPGRDRQRQPTRYLAQIKLMVSGAAYRSEIKTAVDIKCALP